MLQRVAIALVIAALSACVTPPAKVTVSLRTRAPLAASIDSVVDATDDSAWPTPDWWTRFGDAQLNALMLRARGSAPTLEAARARLSAAKAASDSYAAELGIRSTAEADLSRQRLSDTGLISSRLIGFSYYDDAELRLGLQADLDWWGSRRAGLRGALDRERAAAAEQKGAELTLVSAGAATYLQWQIDGERLAWATQRVETLDKLRALQALRVQQGMETQDALRDVEMDEALAEDWSILLGGSVYMRRIELAALMGVAPDEVPLTQSGCAVIPDLSWPSDVGLGVIARRPDVVATRWRVEATVQDVAQARAGFYPDIRLSALAGLSTTDVAKLLNPGSRIPSIGAALYLPIFDARGVRARHKARTADLELAVAIYDETVVSSAQNVATQVNALQGLAARRVQVLRRLAAARQLEQSALSIQDRGIDDGRASLQRRADVLRLEDSAQEVEGELALARIALIKSLGGGIESGV